MAIFIHKVDFLFELIVVTIQMNAGNKIKIINKPVYALSSAEQI